MIDKVKTLMKIVKQVKMIKPVIMRMRSMAGSWETQRKSYAMQMYRNCSFSLGYFSPRRSYPRVLKFWVILGLLRRFLLACVDARLSGVLRDT